MSNAATLSRPASERSHGARRSRPVSCFTPEPEDRSDPSGYAYAASLITGAERARAEASRAPAPTDADAPRLPSIADSLRVLLPQLPESSRDNKSVNGAISELVAATTALEGDTDGLEALAERFKAAIDAVYTATDRYAQRAVLLAMAAKE